jgi:hypothetical protein
MSSLLTAWPTAPRPSEGFADRVMAACLPAPVIVVVPRARRRFNVRALAVAALVALTLLVPFYAARHAAPSTLAALPADRDLGPLQD